MKKILEYSKLVVFIFGVLVGIQIPGVVDQYGKNLEARVSESGKSISAFQDDADKYFNGNMEKLIEYYLAKGDPVIVAGGESIMALVSRYQYLTKSLEDYNQSIYSSYMHVFISPVKEIREDVLNNYTYTVTLNWSAISIGLVVGLLFLIALELSVFLAGVAIHALGKSGKGTPKSGATS